MKQMISVCATDWQTQLSPRLTQGAVFNKLGGGTELTSLKQLADIKNMIHVVCMHS